MSALVREFTPPVFFFTGRLCSSMNCLSSATFESAVTVIEISELWLWRGRISEGWEAADECGTCMAWRLRGFSTVLGVAWPFGIGEFGVAWLLDFAETMSL